MGEQMSAGHRKKLERCTSPVIAWLLDAGYIADDCGVLDVTSMGRQEIARGYADALRQTAAFRMHRLPVSRERLST